MTDEIRKKGAPPLATTEPAELEPLKASNNKDAKDQDDGDESVLGIVEEFGGGTSLPGVPKVVGARSRASRVFWVVICVVCLVMFFWGVSELLQRYFSYPKKVTVEMVSESVPFPSVTLCNMRSLNFHVLNRINKLLIADPTAKAYLNETFDDPFLSEYFNFVSKITHLWNSERRQEPIFSKALDESVTRTALFAEISDEVLSKASIQLEQYVALCTFGGVSCNLTRDFKLMFNAYYFNCYTYHAPGSVIHNQNHKNDDGDDDEDLPWLSPGLDNGLSMALLTGSGMLTKNDDVRVIPGLYDMGSATAGGDGVRVIVHSPDVSAFPLAEGFDVPPGYSASFGVKPRRNFRIGQPHGDCRTEKITVAGSSEGHEETMDYRQLACQQNCVQNYVIERCNCCDETLPCALEGGLPTCHSTQHFPAHCKHHADDACFDALLLEFKRVQCSRQIRDLVRTNRSMIGDCGCRPTCEELVYEVSYSVSSWPAAGFEGDAAFRDIIAIHNFTEAHFNEEEQEILGNLDRSQFMQDLARINVYVADPEVMVIRESPDYEFSQLISDIGGQLGLWIGLSLITAAELVELVGQILSSSVLKRCRRSPTEQQRKSPA